MYEHITKIKKIVEDKGIKFTALKNKTSFDEFMFNHQVRRRKPEVFKSKHGDATGYSWPTSRIRWCTTLLKTNLIENYLKEINKTYNVIQYIGIAADETKRLERANQQKENHKHPLVDWGWTEEDCLNYCYALGYDWGGLYKHFDRVSCWCCPLKSLDELRKLKKYYPELWEELKDMDNRTWQQFRVDYSVKELDKRFEFEEQRIAEGKSIKNKEFFNELKGVIKI